MALFYLSGKEVYMKGYYTSVGYMGWIGNRYMLFSNEGDYYDYMEGDSYDED